MISLQCFEQFWYMQLLQYSFRGGLAVLPGPPTGELSCFSLRLSGLPIQISAHWASLASWSWLSSSHSLAELPELTKCTLFTQGVGLSCRSVFHSWAYLEAHHWAVTAEGHSLGCCHLIMSYLSIIMEGREQSSDESHLPLQLCLS